VNVIIDEEIEAEVETEKVGQKVEIVTEDVIDPEIVIISDETKVLKDTEINETKRNHIDVDLETDQSKDTKIGHQIKIEAEKG
jgi:hypothetical protein